MTLKNAHRKAWKYFSEYIRRRDSVNGYNRCVTCGAIHYWKDMNAGHFRHTGKSLGNHIDFSLENIHPQCVKCNMDDKHVEYYDYMIEEYGREVIDEIIISKNKNQKYTIDELLELAEKYKRMCIEIKENQLL